MKRLHLHIIVDHLAESVEFYSKLFNQTPEKNNKGYAKWFLSEPGLNFAISSNGETLGVNHLGFEADTAEELEQLKTAAENASNGVITEQKETSCCYAKSDKYWTVDPQGIAWEHFRTFDESDTLSGDDADTCCEPLRYNKGDSQCCIPSDSHETNTEGCCAS